MLQSIDKPNCPISFVNYIAAGYVVLFDDGAIYARKLPGGWIITISTTYSTKSPFVEDDFFEKFLVNMHPSL